VELHALLGERRGELVEEARLADAGLALEEHHPSRTGRGQVEQAAQLPKFRLAADDARLAGDDHAMDETLARLRPRLTARSVPPPGVLAAVEHVEDLRRRLHAVGGVLLHERPRELVEHRRSFRDVEAEAPRQFRHGAPQHHADVVVEEGVSTRQHLEEEHAERVEVGACVHRIGVPELLGRRVVHRAEELPVIDRRIDASRSFATPRSMSFTR